MSLTDGSGLSASDVLALTANNNDGFGGNGIGGWWLILFILMMFGGFGWGNNVQGNNGMANMAIPYMMGNSYNADVQRGFDQSAVISALTNLSNAVSSGFAAQSVDSCNKTMAIMQGQNGILQQMANDRFNTITTLNGGHNTILQQMAGYEMARQQGNANVLTQLGQLKYDIATEACADRNALSNATSEIIAAINNGFQAQTMRDMQAQLDAERRVNDQLRSENQLNAFRASQTEQTQQLYSNNQAQTDRIMDYLNPGYARPFLGNGWNGWGGCGCQGCNS